MIYHFLDFELRRSEHRLFHRGIPVDIKPRTFDVLAYLVEHRDRTVSKDELIDGAWQGKLVEESNLTAQISMLRRLLGDGGKTPRFIRTVHTRGYQFIAATTAVLVTAGNTTSHLDRLDREALVSPRAMRLCAAGYTLLGRRTSHSIRRAIQCFEAAIEDAPNHALAHAGLSESLLSLGSAISAILPAMRTAPAARAAALRALDLDPGCAEAYAVLGLIEYEFEWNFEKARELFTKAIDLDPRCAQAHLWRGFMACNAGQKPVARLHLERADESAPLSPIVAAVSGFYMSFAGEPEEGRRLSEYGVARHPSFGTAYSALGFSYLRLGEMKRATDAVTRAVAYRPDVANLAFFTHTVAHAGRRRDARASFDRLERLAHVQHVSQYQTALALVGLERYADAIEMLERAIEHKDGWLVQLAAEPRFEPLWSSARFQGSVKAVGLPGTPSKL